MARVSNSVIARRKGVLLGRLVAWGGAKSDGYASVAHKELAEDLGLSLSELRTALRSLKRERLVEIRPRSLPNGGQLPNAYRLTDAGLRFLSKHAAAAGGDGCGGSGADAGGGVAVGGSIESVESVEGTT